MAEAAGGDAGAARAGADNVAGGDSGKGKGEVRGLAPGRGGHTRQDGPDRGDRSTQATGSWRKATAPSEGRWLLALGAAGAPLLVSLSKPARYAEITVS